MPTNLFFGEVGGYRWYIDPLARWRGTPSAHSFGGGRGRADEDGDLSPRGGTPNSRVIAAPLSRSGSSRASQAGPETDGPWREKSVECTRKTRELVRLRDLGGLK